MECLKSALKDQQQMDWLQRERCFIKVIKTSYRIRGSGFFNVMLQQIIVFMITILAL